MPAAMVVSRYLSDGVDDEDDGVGESALRTVLALRDRMVQLAYLHGRQDLAELLVAGPGRSNRGMDRRVDALAELERLGIATPRADHGVELWFAPALAKRLRSGQIVTLKSLTIVANQKGAGWWRSVPRIGALAGDTINRWMHEHRGLVRDEDGKPLLGSHVGNRTPLQPAALAPDMPQLLPLEMLSEQAAIPDRPAICPFGQGVAVVRAWLQAVSGGSGSTFAAYRKEAERLLLWAAIERRKPLLALDLDDRDAYRDFLAQPEPAARWCGPRAPRHQAAWRPLTGALGSASIRHSMRVLGALFVWMWRQGHHCASLWEPLAGGNQDMAAVDPARQRASEASLAPFHAWLEALAARPEGVRYRAASAAVQLLRAHALSLAQLTTATGSLLLAGAGSTTDGDAAAARQDHQVSQAVLSAVARHWLDRNLEFGAEGTEELPLLGPPALPPTGRAQQKREVARATGYSAGYSARGIHALLSTMLERYRKDCDPGSPLRSPRDLLA